jgi:tetratricopeptide (TPR) repeat protein
MDPNFERAHFHLAQIYWRTGLYKEAVAEIQTLAQFPERSGRLAYIYAASGDKPKARKLLAQALQEKRNEWDLHETDFAKVYVALGDKDEALKWLEQASEHHSYILCYLRVDPEWDPLRSDPRFQDIVHRMAFPQ